MSSTLRVTSSNSRVASSNRGVDSSNPRVQESFNQRNSLKINKKINFRQLVSLDYEKKNPSFVRHIISI